MSVTDIGGRGDSTAIRRHPSFVSQRVPLYHSSATSLRPPFQEASVKATPGTVKLRSTTWKGFWRAPWALAGDGVSLTTLPDQAKQMGLDMQLSLDQDDGNNMGSIANPDEEQESARVLVFRRPTSAELDAGYTSDDFIAATPSIIESPFGHKDPVNRSLFGGKSIIGVVSSSLSSDIPSDVAFYGDAADVVSRILSGAGKAGSDAIQWISNLNLSPEAKKVLKTVGTVAAGYSGLKLGAKLLPGIMVRSALRDGAASKEEASSLPTVASELTVADSLWHGANGNTVGSKGFQAYYDVPLDYWRTMFSLGDVYEHTDAQPHFGLLEGDPSDEVLQAALIGLRAPDLYFTKDGRIVHSPLPYSANVLSGGLLKKIKKAASKVASAATKVVAKVADNPLAQAAAGAFGMGGALKAVGKAADAANKLINGSGSGGSCEPSEAPAPAAQAPAQPATLASAVQEELAPQDVSGDAPAVTTIQDATVADIQDAIRRYTADTQQPNQLPGTWQDYLNGKRVTPELFMEATSGPNSPLVGDPLVGTAIKKGLMWLLKGLAFDAAFNVVSHKISPDAPSSSAPNINERPELKQGAPVTASTAKGSWRTALAGVGRIIRKSGGFVLRGAKRFPKLCGTVLAALGFYAYDWWANQPGTRRQRISAIRDVLSEAARECPETSEDYRQWLAWLDDHASELITADVTNEATVAGFETALMLAGLYVQMKKEEGLELTSSDAVVLSMIDDSKSTLSQADSNKYDGVSAIAAATVQDAASSASAEAPADMAENALDQAIAASSYSQDDDGGTPTEEDQLMAEQIMDDDSYSALLEEAALAGLAADVEGLSDEEASTVRLHSMRDYLASNCIPLAVATSIAGSLLAMIAAKGLAKGAETLQTAKEKALEWWRSKTGGSATAIPQSYSMISIPV